MLCLAAIWKIEGFDVIFEKQNLNLIILPHLGFDMKSYDCINLKEKWLWMLVRFVNTWCY